MATDIETTDLREAAAEVLIDDAVDHFKARLMNGKNLRRQRGGGGTESAKIKLIEPRAERGKAFLNLLRGWGHQAFHCSAR